MPYQSEFARCMRSAKNTRGARKVLSSIQARIAVIQKVGWPALEQSLRAELVECFDIAKARGLLGVKPSPPCDMDVPVFLKARGM